MLGTINPLYLKGCNADAVYSMFIVSVSVAVSRKTTMQVI